MHSTDALYLQIPWPLPLGLNQFHRGKTQLSSGTRLFIGIIHFSCFWMFSSLGHAAQFGEPISSHQLNRMSSSICLIPFMLHFRLNVMWHKSMTGLALPLRHVRARAHPRSSNIDALSRPSASDTNAPFCNGVRHSGLTI